jgi:hypothetical protein
MNGVFLFFLGSMVIAALDTSNETWATFTGRLPYVGVAFLAGYAAQEFLERLKAVAETLFASSTRAEEIKQRWAEATARRPIEASRDKSGTPDGQGSSQPSDDGA